MHDVAVLFASPDSIYKSIAGCDVYDLERDALKYNGNLPVVAHPPCQLWGKFAKINYARWGGDHNRPGNDGGCFAFALAAIRRCGGILEHPATSYAWGHHGLTKPTVIGEWQSCGSSEWVCEVWQSDYGHKARKRTWLFYCGSSPPPSMRSSQTPATHQIGFHDQRGKSANKPNLYGKAASATPIEFARALISIALAPSVALGVGK